MATLPGLQPPPEGCWAKTSNDTASNTYRLFANPGDFAVQRGVGSFLHGDVCVRELVQKLRPSEGLHVTGEGLGDLRRLVRDACRVILVAACKEGGGHRSTRIFDLQGV